MYTKIKINIRYELKITKIQHKRQEQERYCFPIRALMLENILVCSRTSFKSNYRLTRIDGICREIKVPREIFKRYYSLNICMYELAILASPMLVSQRYRF